nr:MAG TPA: hypothetical protein [Caudoviricetes sp.]
MEVFQRIGTASDTFFFGVKNPAGGRFLFLGVCAQ